MPALSEKDERTGQIHYIKHNHEKNDIISVK